MKKENRIKKNEEISQIVAKKQRVQNNYFLIYYQRNEDCFRACISVSKKYGKAFERNKAKRITRELLLPFIKEDVKMDLVVVIKQEIKGEKYAVLEEGMKQLIKKIENKIAEGEKNEKVQY